MSLLLVSLHISLRIILCLNCNQPIVNFISLKLLFCVSKMMFLLHLMLVIVLPFCSLICTAAFDTIDHSILIHRLQHWFGISFIALNLLSSSLSDRSQTVITSASKSQPFPLEYGVPQSSVLGLLLYSLYRTPLLLLYQNILAFVTISMQTTLKYTYLFFLYWLLLFFLLLNLALRMFFLG